MNNTSIQRVGIHGMSQGAGVTNWLSLKKYINDGWEPMDDSPGQMQVQVLLVGWTIGLMAFTPKPIADWLQCPMMSFIS